MRKRILKNGWIVAIWLSVSAFASLEAVFAPKAELWEDWTAHAPNSTVTVDHAAWDRFLDRYLTVHEGGVDTLAYDDVTPTDKKALDAYVAALEEVAVSGLGRDEQYAYWLNFYNALTVKVVLDHWPVKTIRDIDLSSGLFADGPWGKQLVAVEGRELSLNDIEHRILRPIWRDPRIHYGVNCASVGCPDLFPRAFRAATLEADLEQAARTYVNDPRGAHFDGDGDLILSKIYVWFKDDFGGDTAGVLDHLKRYAAPDLRDRLEGADSVLGYEYDWSINAPSGS